MAEFYLEGLASDLCLETALSGFPSLFYQDLHRGGDPFQQDWKYPSSFEFGWVSYLQKSP